MKDKIKKIRVCNAYCGIGGNRKLWNECGVDLEITAIENNKDIAKIYQDFFPDDEVIVADAHQYLLDHYKEYDFIWSSPPCPTHSRINTLLVNGIKSIKARYPDMKLYEEIILLRHFGKEKIWVVENVKSYYKPLIQPQITQRHYWWSNFQITDIGGAKKVINDKGMTLKVKMKNINIKIENWHNYKGDKRTLINNMIEPEIGKHILDCALGKNKQKTLL